MKKSKIAKLENGLYRIVWNSGGTSLAAVGRTRSGAHWIAPTNWVSISDQGNAWADVKKAVLLFK